MSKTGHIYILTNRARGTLYIGVTTDLRIRLQQHRDGNGSAFTRKYRLRRLVYVESHADISMAVGRERLLKKWRRDWKIQLIERLNPAWHDLSDDMHLL
jgi:putative endonuclease